jgi:hypothetical protein
MLWAALPPLMLMFTEKLWFGTSYVASMIGYRLGGWFDHAFRAPTSVEHRITFDDEQIPWPTHLSDVLSVGDYFSNVDLWIGIVVAAAFVWGAVLIRRHRTDI